MFDLYDITNEESLYLKSFFLSLFLIVMSKISMIRPGLPTPFPSVVFFSAELKVTVIPPFAGVAVVNMTAVKAVVGAKVVTIIHGVVVGLSVGVVTVEELVCAGVCVL